MTRTLVLFFLLTCVVASATAQVSLQWAKKYTPQIGTGTDGLGITIDDSLNVYIGGWVDVNITDTFPQVDMITIKYNNGGEQKWVYTKAGAQNSNDYERTITTDNNNIYFAGELAKPSGAGRNFYASALDLNGNSKWEFHQTSCTNKIHTVSAMAMDDSSNIYLTGESYDTSTCTRKLLTLKIDSSGNLKWLRKPNLGYWGTDVFLDEFNNVYTIGLGWGQTDTDGNAHRTIAMIKYDNNGTVIWSQQFGDTIGTFSLPFQGTVDKLGNLYIASSYADSVGVFDDLDIITLKFDSDGQLVWKKTYDIGALDYDRASEIALDNNGNVYVSGGGINTNTGWDGILLKYDSLGTLLWDSKYHGGAGHDNFLKLKLGKDGFVYVAGIAATTVSPNGDMLLAKYHPETGALIWDETFDGEGNADDQANDFVLDSLGNIYVTGHCRDANFRWNMTTLKYSPVTGLQENSINNLSFSIHPNPSTGKISIISNKFSEQNLIIFNSISEKLYSQNIPQTQNTNSFQIDLSGFPNGFYLIQLSDSQSMSVKKLLLQK